MQYSVASFSSQRQSVDSLTRLLAHHIPVGLRDKLLDLNWEGIAL